MATDNSKASQCVKILSYLEEKPVINAKIARALFKCEREYVRNRYKQRVPIMRYFLEETTT